MLAIVSPGSITGMVTAPPSKSLAQRAIAGALLHPGTTTVSCPGRSKDVISCISIVKQLGAVVTEVGADLIIKSAGEIQFNDTIHCGESGLAARLFIPICALSTQPSIIDGGGTLLRRPLKGVTNILSKFGVKIQSTEPDKLPMKVAGPLQPHDATIALEDGSQLLTGLLFALSNIATAPIVLQLSNLTSKPYIDLTIAALSAFGKRIENIGYHTFTIYPRVAVSKAISIAVEGDWSGASALLVAGAIAGRICITNLSRHSQQADRAVIDVLTDAGAFVQWQDNELIVETNTMNAFHFDATNCPDLFPSLAILAAFCSGVSSIAGIGRLYHKETNRALTVTLLLQQLGVKHAIHGDHLEVTGQTHVNGCTINAYQDHRIAMAAAVAALRANAPVSIIGADAVDKSYPDFFAALASCKVNVQTIN